MYSVPSSIAAEADLRRTNLTWGEATLLLGHAGDPRAAAGDTTNVGQTNWSTPATRVSPSPAREPTRPVGRHRPVRVNDDSEPATSPTPEAQQLRWLPAGAHTPGLYDLPVAKRVDDRTAKLCLDDTKLCAPREALHSDHSVVSEIKRFLRRGREVIEGVERVLDVT